ncbi:MAG: thymidylate synthase [Nanoarchaeota archaeon]
MRQYLDLMREVLGTGDVVFEPRTKMYTIGLGGAQKVFDLRDGFPLLTTKNVPLRLPAEELLWKARGNRSVKPLFDRNVHIWDENAYQKWLQRTGLTNERPKHSESWERGFKEYQEALRTSPDAIALGDLGPVYGYQWRHGFARGGEEVDQLRKVVDGLKTNPYSRYHLLTAWNPAALPDMALGPCPMVHQFSAFGDSLDLHTYQRSCDTFLGVPFNIAQDSFLLSLVAREVGLRPRKFFHTYANVHFYLGVPPRGEFWANQDNVSEFQSRFRKINPGDKEEYLKLRDWYVATAPAERDIDARKDHIPFVLTQLSKQLRALPRLELMDGLDFWNVLESGARYEDTAVLHDYHPCKWDAKARMAA